MKTKKTLVWPAQASHNPSFLFARFERFQFRRSSFRSQAHYPSESLLQTQFLRSQSTCYRFVPGGWSVCVHISQSIARSCNNRTDSTSCLFPLAFTSSTPHLHHDRNLWFSRIESICNNSSSLSLPVLARIQSSSSASHFLTLRSPRILHLVMGLNLVDPSVLGEAAGVYIA
ncbi:hypothetical protein C8R42DRAFT_771739 [Lentinula raphanica]|nr:hypothetical protein C8R42DRAFT_771739 [Lentinula raphanica]